MLPDRVSNPGPLTYESSALPIALRGPATNFDARNKILTANLDFLQQGYRYHNFFLSPRTTKLWRGYRVCPVRMYVSTYVRTFVRSFVCSPALATSFIIQFRYNFTQVLDMTIPRTSSRFSVIGSRSRWQ